jgi:2-amino-4-hydroxy-6-hydroxymethyldihydropteridine diphosphokinase
MKKVYLSLGSNTDNSDFLMKQAIELINKNKNINITKKSSLYKTEPWGIKNQNWFLNSIIEIETNYSAIDLLNNCNEIEKILGRNRAFEQRWGQRPIDIDIIFYENEIIKNEKLIIPHKYMHERAFVLVPMNEINSNFVHPSLNKTIKELLENIKTTDKVYKYERNENE